MRSLDRKPITKSSPVSQLAQSEMDQWIEERNRRFKGLSLNVQSVTTRK
jgi:hypothetical protein